jgi:hypothetical protein
VSDGEWRQGRRGSGRSCRSPPSRPTDAGRERRRTRSPSVPHTREPCGSRVAGGRTAAERLPERVCASVSDGGGGRGGATQPPTRARHARVGWRGAARRRRHYSGAGATVRAGAEVMRRRAGRGATGRRRTGGRLLLPLCGGWLPRAGGRPRSASRLYELLELRELRRGAPSGGGRGWRRRAASRGVSWGESRAAP